MTDVRLTATNPEDSSVVPVACNSRGELLIEEVQIERIDNQVTINGGLSVVNEFGDEGDDSSVIGLNLPGYGGLKIDRNEVTVHQFGSNGYATLSRKQDGEEWGLIRFNVSQKAISIHDFNDTRNFQVTYSGVVTALDLQLPTDGYNADNFTTVEKDGEESTEYTGPVISVAEELKFLRAQVRALMEKLKMTPEGGWPVWDGSA